VGEYLPHFGSFDVNLTNTITIPETVTTKTFSTSSMLTSHNAIDTLLQLTLMTPLLTLLESVVERIVRLNSKKETKEVSTSC
jgi:hypothetical protein